MISPTTPSMVRCELSMTWASSAMMSGEAVGARSPCWSRAPIGPAGLAARGAGADFERGVDVKFVGRLGENSGADVAAFHDDVVVAVA